MEHTSHLFRIRVWFGRLAWFTAGTFLILIGLWIVPPCITHRIELINIESVPAEMELFMVKGRTQWDEQLVWQGKFKPLQATRLTFDFGQSTGHYRLRGRHMGMNEFWDRRFSYIGGINYDRAIDIALIGKDEFKLTAWYPASAECPRDDFWCAIPEIAVLAIRVSRCAIKGQEAWWR